MPKIDMSLWNNPRRMRERIRNLASMMMSITAVNSFFMISEKSWFLLGINLFFLISMIPVFMSYSKWQKVPPKEVKDE